MFFFDISINPAFLMFFCNYHFCIYLKVKKLTAKKTAYNSQFCKSRAVVINSTPVLLFGIVRILNFCNPNPCLRKAGRTLYAINITSLRVPLRRHPRLIVRLFAAAVVVAIITALLRAC